MKRRSNLIGQKYGKLIVKQRADNDYVSPKGKKEAKWNCICECGKEKDVRQSDLKSGRVKSCGHCNPPKEKIPKEIKYPNTNGHPHVKDLTGMKIGKLTVVKFLKIDDNRNSIWLCQCECGKSKEISGSLLNTHTALSCGCVTKEKMRNFCMRRNTTHGQSKTRLYKIWQAMKDRCYRTENRHYANYGGRNIIVCDEWENSFEKFQEWSLANGYEKTLSIDRKDVNGNYCPENCKWSTDTEQARNRRNTLYAYYDGKLQLLVNICAITNEKYSTVYTRYRKNNELYGGKYNPIPEDNDA